MWFSAPARSKYARPSASKNGCGIAAVQRATSLLPASSTKCGRSDSARGRSLSCALVKGVPFQTAPQHPSSDGTDTEDALERGPDPGLAASDPNIDGEVHLPRLQMLDHGLGVEVGQSFARRSNLDTPDRDTK